MSRLFQVKSFFTYWLDAVDGHSLHSPFFFDLYSKAIKKEANDDAYASIELLRSNLLLNNAPIEFADLGSGSSFPKGSRRTISSIAQASISPQKYSRLYQRIIDYFQCQNIIELGTSLGINTLYLASRTGSRVSTFEGSVAIAEEAQKQFTAAGATNIELTTGDLDYTLPAYLLHAEKIDFAFIDANHRYQPTRNYFNGILQKVHQHSVIVLDDIHYTREMEQAWNDIRQHYLVFGTVDLFRCGLVFFDPTLNRQHHVLRF